MGCGFCVDQCPQQAVALVRDERKGAPLDVRVLAATTWGMRDREIAASQVVSRC